MNVPQLQPTSLPRRFVDNSGLLVVGTVLALVWANADLSSYQHWTHVLHFAVNDVGMALFFALAAKEVVEATAPGGALNAPKEAAVPLVAAVGGMAVPALFYLALAAMADRPDLMRGWAIPCATDIAFSYLVARAVFGPGHPAIPFLLLLAIADDALGLLILAVFYPSGPLRPIEGGVLLAAAVTVAWWLRRRQTASFWPYILGAGALSWLAFYRGGLHPALALVPIIPFLPHAARDPGLFVNGPSGHDTLSTFEHWWKLPVQGVLFFFGLVNAGVEFASIGTGTWVVLIAILVGKPIGIVGSTWLGVVCGLQRARGVEWRDIMVVSLVAAIGFTVALFFATAAFSSGPALDETKMGALLSFGAAVLAVAAAAALRTGRFAGHQNPSRRQ
jgi:NhaA family Na+:H+ antiporter